MGRYWTLRRITARRFSRSRRRRSARAIHHGDLRRRLLRVAGYGDRATAAVAALLRDVRPAARSRARRSAATAAADEARIQTSEVRDDDRRHRRPAGEAQLLGRPGLQLVRRAVK